MNNLQVAAIVHREERKELARVHSDFGASCLVAVVGERRQVLFVLARATHRWHDTLRPLPDVRFATNALKIRAGGGARARGARTRSYVMCVLSVCLFLRS
jgi:hypothetical protein